MNLRINRWLFALVGLSLLITFALVPGQARGDAQTFSGQATVVKATVLGTNTTLVDTGPLPSSGGALEASLLTANVDGLSAEILDAATVGQGNASRAEASVTHLSLTVGGNTISADFLMATATAECNAGGAIVSGGSEILGLVINGQSIVVGAPPNQTILLPNGQVVINEQ